MRPQVILNCLIGIAFSGALLQYSEAHAQNDLRSLLSGNIYHCNGFLFEISFQKNGSIILLYADAIGTSEIVARVPAARIKWTDDTVFFTDKQDRYRLYVSGGNEPKLVADISGDGVMNGEVLRGGICELDVRHRGTRWQ